MEWDEKKVGLLVIAAMLLSFVWMITTGISAANILPVLTFSITLSFALVIFGDWFGKEE